MKPSLQLKLTQHLALTPQLQQSIRLLQLSTIELEQELEKYLLENPLLEREEEYARTEAPTPVARKRPPTRWRRTSTQNVPNSPSTVNNRSPTTTPGR
jgi:RNA polymerase sigma-54 factor